MLDFYSWCYTLVITRADKLGSTFSWINFNIIEIQIHLLKLFLKFSNKTFDNKNWSGNVIITQIGLRVYHTGMEIIFVCY